MKIGLFFGSFNPIHNGHLIIANQIINYTDCKKIWFVVSPHNPLKDKNTLLNQYDRLQMVNLAIQDNVAFKSCDIEFKQSAPSYTIDTLQLLEEKYPKHQFVLIMGSDNLLSLNKWKNYETLLANYSIYVYNRGNTINPYSSYINVKIFDFSFINISSTYIRQLVREKKSIRYFVPDPVCEYIKNNGYYK